LQVELHVLRIVGPQLKAFLNLLPKWLIFLLWRFVIIILMIKLRSLISLKVKRIGNC
jgi:hypothetical protein